MKSCKCGWFLLQISKSNVVDDMVASNSILFQPNEKPDHCVVIKYVPYVGEFLFLHFHSFIILMLMV